MMLSTLPKPFSGDINLNEPANVERGLVFEPHRAQEAVLA